MGINYKLVNTPMDFRHELQSSIYGQYWLLGAIENLSPHMYKELVERVHTGENLLFDAGMHSWLNHDLFKLAGVKYQGTMVINNTQITTNSQFITTLKDQKIETSPLWIDSKIKGQPLNSRWGLSLKPTSNQTKIWAIFGNNKQLLNNIPATAQRMNALSSATYGNGSPIVASFDLISSLDLAKKSTLPIYQQQANTSQLHWDNALRQLLKSRQIKVRSEYAPREPVKIPLTLNNPSNQIKHLSIEVNLPTGSNWLGTTGGINANNDLTTKQKFEVILQPKETRQQVIAIRLPAHSATHAVGIHIAQNNQTINRLESRFFVRDIQSRINILKQHIDTWKVVGENGTLALNAKTQLGLIQTHIKTGVDELAVYEAANLATTLSKMQETPMHQATQLRYEADELLRALQIKWHLSRQSNRPLP